MMRWLTTPAPTLAALTFGLLALHYCTPARAHDAPLGWRYPWSCCSNQDCRQVPQDWVREAPDGYHVAGETIPYGDKRLKDSPDGEVHWCAHQAGIDAGRTICLFVPPRGF